MSVLKSLYKNDLASVLLPVVLLLVLLGASSPGFLSSYNITSLLQTITIYMLIGLAQMSALSLGHLNLAVGSIGAFTSIVMGFGMQEMHLPLLVALVVGLFVGVLCGALQGFLIAKSGVSPFIVTLALLSVFKGLATIISKGVPFSRLPEGITALNRTRVLGSIPVAFLGAVFVLAIVLIVFGYLKVGIRTKAAGASPRAATYSGITVSRIVVFGHAFSGFLCSIAAIVQTARFGSAQISVGDDWMLTSFVVAVLGGTLLSGGKASPLGTFFGSVLMVLINNALVLWNVTTYMFPAILGIVLLLSYELDRGRISFIRRQSDVNLRVKREEQDVGVERHV